MRCYQDEIQNIYTHIRKMPVRLTKERQQDIVADFVYEKNLEMCMFVYLDEFLDHHHKLYP